MWKKNLLTVRIQFKQTNINSEKQNVIPILFTIAKCEKQISNTNTHTYTRAFTQTKQNKDMLLELYKSTKTGKKIESNHTDSLHPAGSDDGKRPEMSAVPFPNK